MTRPNFKLMSKRELRAYVLAHRDDDEAFYAYMDRKYEANTAVKAAVCQWLQLQNPYHAIINRPAGSSRLVMTAPKGHETGVNISTLMMTSLPTYKPLIELLIEEVIKEIQREFSHFITIFLSKNEWDAIKLDKELSEVSFNSRTKSSYLVGYLELGGKFQKI